MPEITSEKNGRLKLDPFVAFQLVAWIVGALLTYGAVNARVAVLEAKYDVLKEQFTVINAKLDRLLEQGR